MPVVQYKDKEGKWVTQDFQSRKDIPEHAQLYLDGALRTLKDQQRELGVQDSQLDRQEQMKLLINMYKNCSLIGIKITGNSIIQRNK